MSNDLTHTDKLLIQARMALMDSRDDAAIDMVQEIDKHLVRAFGASLPWQFFYAEPSNTAAPRARWAAEGCKALQAHLDDIMEDVRQHYSRLGTGEEG